jgi:hypothetical protein
MNKILSATLLCLLALTFSAFAGGTKIDGKSWAKLQTFDVRTLAPKMEGHARDLVAVKFNFRGKDIHHLKPNWYEGSIWQPDPKGKKGFSDVRVMIAKKDLDAFKAITTDSTAGEEMTVYGRVLRDFDAHFMFVQVMGTKATTDANGNTTIGW